MEKEKKEFFASIAKLPLQQKVVEVRKNFANEDEAFGIIIPLVCRDQTLSMDEKIEFAETEFPQRKQEFIEMLEKKHNSKPRNLSNRLHLTDVLKKELSGVEKKSRDENNRKVLNTINAFLVEKREQDEYVEKSDCELIQQLMQPDMYLEFRDQYNSLIINCFRFRKQLIKKQASSFVRAIFSKGKIDTVLLLELVRGGYVSTETMGLLKEFSEPISKNQLLLEEIRVELRNLKELPKTGDERKLLESIMLLYNA